MTKRKIFQVRLAERIAEIHTLYDDTRILCKDYILDQDRPETPDCIIEISHKDILQENDQCQSQAYREGKEIYLYHDPGYLETYAVYRKICDIYPGFHTFSMHGAVVAYEGKGYLFAAPSGVGKTTRARLWLEEFPGAFVVNGDKPLLRVTEKDVFAFGTPWCGKEHWNTNTGVALQAIFLLERTETDEKTSIRPVSLTEAYAELFEQVYKPEDQAALYQTICLLKQLCKIVKVYRFRSAFSREAVRLAWEMTNGERETII